jgi:hypothetical protein
MLEGPVVGARVEDEVIGGKWVESRGGAGIVVAVGM